MSKCRPGAIGQVEMSYWSKWTGRKSAAEGLECRLRQVGPEQARSPWNVACTRVPTGASAEPNERQRSEMERRQSQMQRWKDWTQVLSLRGSSVCLKSRTDSKVHAYKSVRIGIHLDPDSSFAGWR